MSIVSKVIDRFNAKPTKIQIAFPTKIEKNDPKICMVPQKPLGPQAAKAILQKEKRTCKYHTFYFQSTVAKL